MRVIYRVVFDKGSMALFFYIIVYAATGCSCEFNYCMALKYFGLRPALLNSLEALYRGLYLTVKKAGQIT